MALARRSNSLKPSGRSPPANAPAFPDDPGTTHYPDVNQRSTLVRQS